MPNLATPAAESNAARLRHLSQVCDAAIAAGDGAAADEAAEARAHIMWALVDRCPQSIPDVTDRLEVALENMARDRGGLDRIEAMLISSALDALRQLVH